MATLAVHVRLAAHEGVLRDLRRRDAKRHQSLGSMAAEAQRKSHQSLGSIGSAIQKPPVVGRQHGGATQKASVVGSTAAEAQRSGSAALRRPGRSRSSSAGTCSSLCGPGALEGTQPEVIKAIVLEGSPCLPRGLCHVAGHTSDGRVGGADRSGGLERLVHAVDGEHVQGRAVDGEVRDGALEVAAPEDLAAGVVDGVLAEDDRHGGELEAGERRCHPELKV